jgi:hypothetical protein
MPRLWAVSNLLQIQAFGINASNIFVDLSVAGKLRSLLQAQNVIFHPLTYGAPVGFEGLRVNRTPDDLAKLLEDFI